MYLILNKCGLIYNYVEKFEFPHVIHEFFCRLNSVGAPDPDADVTEFLIAVSHRQPSM